jgi:GTP-binding protein HflX
LELDRVKERERVILVGIYGRDVERETAEEHLAELALLTDTAGGIPVGTVLQQRLKPDVATYVGKGKLDDIVRLAGETQAEVVIFDDDLSPSQARNIHNHTKKKVLDRSGLILDIFAARAKSAAAKTQVELAQLEYLLPRLTRYWSHLERQTGGIGTRGPGETQLETDRRLIGKRIALLEEKLEKLERQRTTQRSGRAERLRVALVGYTNAGKSSLMNALTDAGVYAEDKLFATLDATTRQMKIGASTYLLSDTVGFIRKLPHGLVESFKSTLDEINESDVLLHVVDAATVVRDENMSVVQETLKEIGAGEKPSILVMNKIDALPDREALSDLMAHYPDAVFVSATRFIGLDTLRHQIVKTLADFWVDAAISLPFDRYDLVSRLKRSADILEEKIEQDGYHFRFRMGREDHARFVIYAKNAISPQSTAAAEP